MRVGEHLPALSYRVTRVDLIRYAGASRDFNPIHWSDRFARKVGLPGVISHGMFTMALVGRAVTQWAGTPDAIVDFGVRFTRPVVVPDDDTGTEVVVSAVVKEIGADGLAQLDLTATCNDEKILAQARAVVRTPDRGVAG